MEIQGGPESVSVSLGEVSTPEGSGDNEQAEDNPEEHSNTDNYTVMNFFKTLVNKTPKKEAATPDVAKDQKEPAPTAPATTTTTTTVAQVLDPPAAPKGMNIPPPPPPAPPVPGSAPAKPQTTAAEAPKDAAKEPEATKAKSTKSSPFSKLFRPKTAEATPKAVPVQVDASKTSTLEADAKPAPPPAPAAPAAPEDKPAAPKAASFRSLFKPGKVLLDQVASKVQASTSGMRLFTKAAGGAAEAKKEPSAPPAEAEAGAATKAKEEPKAPPPAKSTEAPPPADSQSTESGEDAAIIPRKEKRNSIHLFFKTLGQKRQSDAGVQTEPAKASSSEKTK